MRTQLTYQLKFGGITKYLDEINNHQILYSNKYGLGYVQESSNEG